MKSNEELSRRLWWQSVTNATQKTALESGGLGIAELVSASVSLGVFGLVEKVVPKLHGNAVDVVGKVISPYVDNFEWLMSKLCKLEECQPDPTLNHEEKTRRYARLGLLFSEAFAASFIAKIATRRGINGLLGLNHPRAKTGNWFMDHCLPSRHDLLVVAADEGVHIGSMFVMNTVGASYTDYLLHSVTQVLEKTGMSHDKAKEMATMGVVWELPNALGWLAGATKIAYDHTSREFERLDRIQKKLAAQSAAHPNIHP